MTLHNDMLMLKLTLNGVYLKQHRGRMIINTTLNETHSIQDIELFSFACHETTASFVFLLSGYQSFVPARVKSSIQPCLPPPALPVYN